MDKFPEIKVMPILDRVINVGLWAGRLITHQFGHAPATHGDHFADARPDIWYGEPRPWTQAELDSLYEKVRDDASIPFRHE